MVSTMKFVGATVGELLTHASGSAVDGDVTSAAERLLESLEPIGASFDVPWKFNDSLDVLCEWLPFELRERLMHPGGHRPENHLEACLVALALEAGVALEPLTRTEMLRLQQTAEHATSCAAWGRQSPYPWDTVAKADIDGYDFFALATPS